MVSLQDRTRWSRQVHGVRIPRSAWAALEDTQAILDQANQAWQQTRQDIAQLRENAYRQGWQEGHEQALQQWQNTLLDAQLQARQWLDETDLRVVALAQAILCRLLPRLSEQEVVAEMLTQACREISAKRYLRVRVHPDVLSLAARTVSARQVARTAQVEPELVADPTLPRLGCVVESELGQLSAGPDVLLPELIAGLQTCARNTVDTEAKHG